MREWIRVGVACLALSAIAVHAQAVAPQEVHNQVQLSASATVEVQQDWLTLSLSTTREGADPAVLQTQLRQATEAALAIVKPMAQEGAMEVRSGQFSLQPRYNRDGKISAWAGSTELVLEGRDFARIGAAAGKVQSLVVSGTSFSLSRDARAKAEAEAQGQAIERYKQRASAIAKGFGFANYSLREVSVSANDLMPVPRMAMMARAEKSMVADAPVPLESGKSTVTVMVSGSVQLK